MFADQKSYDLARRAEDAQYQLNADRRRNQKAESSWREVIDVPKRRLQAFWCGPCRLDYMAIGTKSVITCLGRPIATLQSRCPKCGMTRVRRGTERSGDVYWLQARRVWKDRFQYMADTLQPGQWGFNTLYPEFFSEEVEKMVGREEYIRDRHHDDSMRLSRTEELELELRSADYREKKWGL